MAMRHRPRLLHSLRRHPDPARSANPRTQLVLAGLAGLPSAAPTAEFRTELRQQLVAVAPRLVAEGSDAAKSVPVAPRRSGGLARVLKPAAILLSAAAVFIMLTGAAVLLSGKALPGDSLYSVKRASENVQLSLSGSDTDKGKRYLGMASNRASEVSKLLGESSATAAAGGVSSAGAISEHTAKLVTSTLDDQDSETRSGAQLINGQALRTASSSPLHILIDWEPDQDATLNKIIARIPAGALHNRAVASKAVLAAAAARSKALLPSIAAPCQVATSSDVYGPIPVPGCTPANPDPAPATTPVPVPVTATTAPSVPGNASTSPRVGVPTVPNASSTAGNPVIVPVTPGTHGSTSSATPTGGPPTTLPTIPGVPTQPVTVGVCGLGANLPPLVSLGLGTCGISVGVGGN